MADAGLARHSARHVAITAGEPDSARAIPRHTRLFAKDATF